MPFGADTPTPEFVGNSRVRGARSPPGTHGDLTTPWVGTPRPGGGHTDPPGDFARAKRRSVARRTSSRESGAAPPARTSPEQSRKVLCPGGLFQSKAEKCAARRTFAEQSRKVCPAAVPGGGSVCPPGRQKIARPAKKNRVFSRPLRACIRKRGLLFRKKNR